MPLNLPSFNLSIYSIPKNGSTTLWMWGYLLRTGEECQKDIYANGWMYDGPPEAESLMVRWDPVERFISGYRNSRDKRGLVVGFSEFVRRFPELMASNREWAHHFRAQADFFPEVPLREVDHVFDFTEFDKVRGFLEERAGRELPRYHEQKSYFDDFEVSDAEVEMIRDYFLGDYLEGFGELYERRSGGNSRRIIETAAVGDLPYARQTVPRMRRYAKEVGADFRLTTSFDAQEAYGGSAYYIAVDLMQKFSEQSEYEELLFLDADVLVGREAPNAFEELEGAEMAMVTDNCLKTQDGHFQAWLDENEGSLEHYSEGGVYFNSGVVLISLEGARKLDFGGPYPVCPWYDQDWINLRVAQAGLLVKCLERKWNEWPEGEVFKDLEKSCFLHFVGPRKKLLGRYLARLEREEEERERVSCSDERCFLVLCREPGEKTENLRGVLGKFGRVVVISDEVCEEEAGVHVPDEEMDGFELMNYFEGQRKAVTAWERAWRFLSVGVGEMTGPVWFVEDDVAGGIESWSELIEVTERVDADYSACGVKTIEDDRDWEHWGKGAEFFKDPARSFNPLCRVSGRLVMTVLEFRRCHRRFCFLEIIFASLVREHGLSYLDWREDDLLASTTGSLRYRPEVKWSQEPEPEVC